MLDKRPGVKDTKTANLQAMHSLITSDYHNVVHCETILRSQSLYQKEHCTYII
jgi:hypothetical protein